MACWVENAGAISLAEIQRKGLSPHRDSGARCKRLVQVIQAYRCHGLLGNAWAVLLAEIDKVVHVVTLQHLQAQNRAKIHIIMTLSSN